MSHPFSLSYLSNEELLAGLEALVKQDHQVTAALIAHLAEIDERRLFVGEGCSSLLGYCVDVLHLSEPAACRRIQVARSAREYPIILDRLADGSVTLTTLVVLGPCLTPENHRELLEAARHKSKREVERLAVQVRPLPPVPAVVRKLPQPRAGATDVSLELLCGPNGEGVGSQAPDSEKVSPVRGNFADGRFSQAETAAGQCQSVAIPLEAPRASEPVPAPATVRRPVVAPLTPELYKVQFTATAETYKKLRQVQELLRHQIPNGDPAQIVDRALTLLLEKLTKEKFAATDRPRKLKKSVKTGNAPGVRHASQNGTGNHARSESGSIRRPRPTESRHLVAEVKRTVWRRDGGRCAFVSRGGRRCTERGRLEFHHVKPYMLGGKGTIDNIELRCRTHNAYEGELVFGSKKMRSRAGLASATSTATVTGGQPGCAPASVGPISAIGVVGGEASPEFAPARVREVTAIRIRAVPRQAFERSVVSRLRNDGVAGPRTASPPAAS